MGHSGKSLRTTDLNGTLEEIQEERQDLLIYTISNQLKCYKMLYNYTYVDLIVALKISEMAVQVFSFINVSKIKTRGQSKVTRGI